MSHFSHHSEVNVDVIEVNRRQLRPWSTFSVPSTTCWISIGNRCLSDYCTWSWLQRQRWSWLMCESCLIKHYNKTIFMISFLEKLPETSDLVILFPPGPSPLSTLRCPGAHREWASWRVIQDTESNHEMSILRISIWMSSKYLQIWYCKYW